MHSQNIEIKEFTTHRLVKSEDLNHHGTLFAGRSAEWFVESGFIAVASLLPVHNIICVKIHGMTFKKPVKPGEIVKFSSKVVYTGTSSLIAHVNVCSASDACQSIVDGFITFVHVDENTKPSAHGIKMIANNPLDTELQLQAKTLKNK